MDGHGRLINQNLPSDINENDHFPVYPIQQKHLLHQITGNFILITFTGDIRTNIHSFCTNLIVMPL